jgi:hypothetical protein
MVKMKVFLKLCLLMERFGSNAGTVQIITDPGGPKTYRSYATETLILRSKIQDQVKNGRCTEGNLARYYDERWP